MDKTRPAGMRTPTIEDIKQEMKQLPARKLIELCLRLARSKKESKELLAYLIFESHDDQAYTESVKSEVDDLFSGLPAQTTYLSKKALRKILRLISKHSKFMASKEKTASLLLHFCVQLKGKGLAGPGYPSLQKIFLQQIKKLDALIPSIEEDLQYDFRKELEAIQSKK